MAKTFVVEKEIRGTKYKFQYNGVLAAVRCTDNTYMDDRDIRSTEKTSDYLLNHVIVEPKRKIDDFEDLAEFNEVIKFAGEVMRGLHKEDAINEE